MAFEFSLSQWLSHRGFVVFQRFSVVFNGLSIYYVWPVQIISQVSSDPGCPLRRIVMKRSTQVATPLCGEV